MRNEFYPSLASSDLLLLLLLLSLILQKITTFRAHYASVVVTVSIIRRRHRRGRRGRVQHHRFGTARDDRKFDRIFVLSVVKQSKEKKEKNNKKKKYKNVDFFIFLILNPTTQGLSGGMISLYSLKRHSKTLNKASGSKPDCGRHTPFDIKSKHHKPR